MYMYTEDYNKVNDIVTDILKKIKVTLNELSTIEPIRGSKEGSLSITYPTFNCEDFEVSFQSKYIGPNMSEVWTGKNLLKTLETAQADIFNWCEIELEMPTPHRHFLLDGLI